MRNWVNSSTMGERRVADPGILPRLRVAVRVISEDDYLQYLAQGPPGPSLYESEKKFPIIISNPQIWKIGHLVAEIRRQFKQSWEDIAIKYLSHGFDDCQLHKELSVYDHLYDEGKAQSDSSDQNVVVKAVYSQGRPLRDGSVVPDFEDPAYDRRPIPPVPVPSWSDVPPRRGKRPAEEDDDGYFGLNDFSSFKRSRVDGVGDATSDGGILASVERYGTTNIGDHVLPDSPVLVQDSQSSPQHEQPQTLQPSLSVSAYAEQSAPIMNSKLESFSDTSTEPPLPKLHKYLLDNSNRTHNQTLLTPPSDASKRAFSGNMNPGQMQGSKRKSLPALTGSTGLRRPSGVKDDTYDIEAVDPIVYTQMSPTLKTAADNRLSSSSSGPQGLRKQKGRDTASYKGSIPHGEIVKLMDSGSKVLTEPSAGVRKDISYVGNDDAVVEEETSTILPEIERRNEKSTDSLKLPSTTLLGDHKSSTASSHSLTGKNENLKRRRETREKSNVNDNQPSGSLSLDSTDSLHNTRQSTPVDSPGEQLLEMQASSQKTQSDQMSKEEKKAAKRARKKREKEEKAARTPGKANTKKGSKSQPQQQKQKGIGRAEPTHPLSGVLTESLKKSSSKNRTTKTLHERQSPPKESIGLGFTNSTREQSSESTDDGSLPKRRLFESNPLLKDPTLKDNENSSHIDDNNSDSSISTPSKNVVAENTHTSYQKIIAKNRPNLPPAEPTRSDTPRSTSVPLPVGMTLEQFEAKRKKYEEDIANGKHLSKNKNQRPTTTKKASAEKDLQQAPPSLTNDGSKGSHLSVIPFATVKSKKKKPAAQEANAEQKESQAETEEPMSKKRKNRKLKDEQSVETEVGLERQQSGALKNVTPALASVPPMKDKKATKPAATATSTSSATSSDSSRASQISAATASAPAKISISSATAPPKVAISTTTTSKPNISAGESLLKGLRNRIADKSAKSSPAPQILAPPASKVASKTFEIGASDDDDDDESSDEDEDEEKLREKSTRIMAASRPDVSTRNQTVESGTEDDAEEDDDE